ncbi:hypothetical protein I5H08_gp082 [Mycobacterium phage Yuna]|uniref:Uncharacterized protein n=1 Tax=Mycobacterium phage Yuna TaxID=2599885 RepID=A0A5J6TFI6_9CAUD|nr:hypothetical protein I5H08_gp082 [Mycobacterium phage Yuna]QFG09405.1 hypothetical protein PBI_YUNA_23 [Mycobacterium phage Yuna]
MTVLKTDWKTGERVQAGEFNLLSEQVNANTAAIEGGSELAVWSSPSPVFMLGSATDWTDVPGAAIEFTSGARPVSILFQAGTLRHVAGGEAIQIDVRIVQGATQLAMLRQRVMNWWPDINLAPLHSRIAPGGGLLTVKAQYRCSYAENGTDQSTINPADIPTLMLLQAVEV